MSGTAAAKTCGICGADCAGKPRTKDKSGRYFCKECYDAALVRKHAHDGVGAASAKAARSAGTRVATASPADAPPRNDFGLLDELLKDQEEAAAPPTSAARMCTNCRAPLAADAKLCVACGFNTQSGKAMEVTVKKAARAPALGEWRGPSIFAAIALAIVLGFFVAGQGSAAGGGMFLLFWLMGSLAYLFWVVRAAGKHGGTLLALAVFFIPFFYLYFVFVQYPGRYLKVATVCQVVAAALFFATIPAFEKFNEEAKRRQHEMLTGTRVPRSSPHQ